MADVPRAPSRIGFTRPPLQRQDNTLCSEWNYCEDICEEDEEWEGEYAGDLLYPPGGRPGVDRPEEPHLDPPPILKPSLPSQTISISCVPVRLLSSTYTSLAEPSMTMHDDEPVIPDHGLSRSALTHLKEFWSTRKTEWTRRESMLAHNNAASGYGASRDTWRAGLFGRLAPRRAAAAVPEPIVSAEVALPPANTPIYPRTGDLLRLRDARFATMDRAFSNIPLHSITKMLFLHDMLDRSASSTPASSRCNSPASLLTELDDSSGSVTDDSDASFVDVSLLNSTSETGNADDGLPIEQRPCAGSAKLDCDAVIVAGEHEHPGARAWEVDWSARWRVLLHTTRSASLPAIDEDALLQALQSVSIDPTIPVCARSKSPASPTRTRFFIGADEEDEDDYFSSYDADADDEEDYGRVIRRTIYTDADFYASYEHGLQLTGY